jgi:hypothetical protein
LFDLEYTDYPLYYFDDQNGSGYLNSNLRYDSVNNVYYFNEMPELLENISKNNIQYVKYEENEVIDSTNSYFFASGPDTYVKAIMPEEFPYTVKTGDVYCRPDGTLYTPGETIASTDTYYVNNGSSLIQSITSFPYIVQANDEYYKDANKWISNTNSTGNPIAVARWGVFFYNANIKYILCNHDRKIVYDGSVDCDKFIRGIINNAFTNNDNYTNTNDEVNNPMNGLYSDYISVRFAKTNGNYDCSYYIRKFKKVPGSHNMTLDNETYPLAFSNTIYGDSIAQSVFTDSVNVGDLKDNLGRD